jgi:hypothetical protein
VSATFLDKSNSADVQIVSFQRDGPAGLFFMETQLTSTQATIIASPASGVDGNLAKIEKVVLDHLGRAWII